MASHTRKAVTQARSILNGLYLLDEFKGDINGKPFEGMQITGYSKEKQKYFGIWLDSFSTTPETVWGTADSTGKVITFDGEARMCPMGEFLPRWVLKLDDDDHRTFEHWAKFEDKPDYMKGLDIQYTRRK